MNGVVVIALFFFVLGSLGIIGGFVTAQLTPGTLVFSIVLMLPYIYIQYQEGKKKTETVSDNVS